MAELVLPKPTARESGLGPPERPSGQGCLRGEKAFFIKGGARQEQALCSRKVVKASQALGGIKVWGETGQPLMFFPRLGFWNSTPRERRNEAVASEAISHDPLELPLHSLGHFRLEPRAPLGLRLETIS